MNQVDASLRRQLDQLIRANFAKPLHQLSFARFLADLLQIANRAGLQVPGNLGLFVKAVTNLEGVGRELNPGFSFTEAMKPLVSRLMARALLLPQQRVMQFGLDLRTRLEGQSAAAGQRVEKGVRRPADPCQNGLLRIGNAVDHLDHSEPVGSKEDHAFAGFTLCADNDGDRANVNRLDVSSSLS